MKNIKKLLFVLFVGVSFLGYAQNFQLTNNEGTPYTDGQIISIAINENDLAGSFQEFVLNINVENLTDDVLSVRTIRENVKLDAGVFAYVCFGDCDETGEQFMMMWDIESGENEKYSIHLSPNGHFGLSQFKIDFMNAETPEIPGQFMTLYVNIDMQPLSVKEQNKDKVSLNAYPNPVASGSKVNISYTLPDKNISNKLIIRNILGSEVLSFPLNPNEKNIAIDTSPLVQGVYFYTIENNNHIYMAKKLIVK